MNLNKSKHIEVLDGSALHLSKFYLDNVVDNKSIIVNPENQHSMMINEEIQSYLKRKGKCNI